MEVLSIFNIAILLIAGVFTGAVNTLAGSGTIISVGTMLFLGIPMELANTTNRLGVFFQNGAGVLSIKKYGNVSGIKVPGTSIIITLVGATVGANFAVSIENRTLETCALAVIGLMIIYVILDIAGHSILQKTIKFSTIHPMTKGVIFFAIGLYGGFIQIGVGILMLIGLRAIYQKDWVESNYLKLIIILSYTIPTLLLFGFHEMILWIPGLILAFGQIIGAYISGWGISVNQKLIQTIPYFILIMLTVTGFKILLTWI